MTKGPNHFPREGLHQTVTASHLRELESRRPVPAPSLEYTIGGTVEQDVHGSVRASQEAQREYTLRRGHKLLHGASDRMNAGFASNTQQGFHAPRFNLESLNTRAKQRRDREGLGHAFGRSKGQDI
ncbi:hypothetical protein JQU17_22210 [Ponticoccus sp. SC2-23]|uniref:hypothetical protein n=1 Tax=Alexandriicola marinus TaxID=2081710 RepID=UPI000FD7F0A3|nr:hypothetical protein [Alexandriicola marinus]MBM1222922.1 hypothetical protein [Ponticoccus sp. SC6-9]MBM1227345.1 hypothetical protein [Ponticoccus sp. SC6-15]MBM1231848.1 hypothetical protein [Ponticoccus sp. SC6-38]MBM1236378.1 hypothetical protein [Ponticoccus sp. SC6-45]MBM1240870.1 hypothetical protein [Ponticoccus sp. SC6-49]MBM1245396.1 hypothetical protein [Ponticoccus sp. SC2-64]MBM1249852.1 hypothetical protein [Ponticoccus sp. SC6-42]MBM1254358.1 hypothetical protein [Pontico